MVSLIPGIYSLPPFFLVPHFAMLIVNKVIAYCMFLYTIASIYLHFYSFTFSFLGIDASTFNFLMHC